MWRVFICELLYLFQRGRVRNSPHQPDRHKSDGTRFNPISKGPYRRFAGATSWPSHMTAPFIWGRGAASTERLSVWSWKPLWAWWFINNPRMLPRCRRVHVPECPNPPLASDVQLCLTSICPLCLVLSAVCVRPESHAPSLVHPRLKCW